MSRNTETAISALKAQLADMVAQLETLANAPTVEKAQPTEFRSEDMGNGWIAQTRDAGTYVDKSGKLREGRALTQVRNAELDVTIKVYAPTLEEVARRVNGAIRANGRAPRSRK